MKHASRVVDVPHDDDTVMMCLQSRKNLTANYVKSMQRWRSLSSVGQLKLKATHAHNLTHTIFRVQLDHTLSFTHIFVTA